MIIIKMSKIKIGKDKIMKHKRLLSLAIFFSGSFVLYNAAFADSQDDIAKQLANPVAALISVPIQANYDQNYGANDNGSVWRINIQPVLPFSISKDWNLISRTILPVIDQEDIPIDGAGESGLGDISQSFFFSPKKPTSNGFIWGVGPILLLNSATDKALGSEKWGIGPTGVILRQTGSWTYGMLANHIESFAGEDSRADISATFIQPFISYVTKTKTTFSISSESTYDWKNEKWSVPVIVNVAQLLKIGNQLLSVGGGVRYWAEGPDNGPEDWGFRLQVTFLIPN